MDQTTLAQRDELASEHQLGRLEMQRTPRTFKAWALLFGGILAGCFLLYMAVIYFSGLPFSKSFLQSLTIDVAIFAISLFGLLFIPGIVHSFTYSTVYIYTNGLVYLNRDRSGVARWEEIERVDPQRDGSAERSSTLDVYLHDGTRISFLPGTRISFLPIYASRGSASLSALHTFIHQRISPAHLRASDR
jgi:hypothetical protein